MIRAKFKCTSVQSFEGGSESIALSAVVSGDENKQWSKFTPSGSLTMSITADGATGQFKAGGEYFLDFTPAS